MSDKQERIYGVTSKGDGIVTELRENNGVLEYKNKLGQYVPVNSGGGGSSKPVVAHSDDGVNYYVTLDPAPEELYIGMHLTIIPDAYSTNQRAKLYVNDLGPYEFSMQTYIMGTYGKPASSYFLQENCPVNIIFGPARNNNYSYWWIEDYSKPYWNDIGYKPDWLTAVNNLNTEAAGAGLLDAYQGKVLRDMIDIEDITHAQLVALRNSSGLIPGHLYRITDYKAYWHVKFPNGQVQTHFSSVEPLIVQAIRNNELSALAISPSHPEDIIYYELDNDAEKYSWAVTTTSDATSGKGVIYRRIDTKRNIDVYYDWRNISFSRFKIDDSQFKYPDADDFDGCSAGDFLYTNVIYFCYNTPPNNEFLKKGAFPDPKYFVFVMSPEYINSYKVMCSDGIDIYNVGPYDANYEMNAVNQYTDHKTFASDARNVKITTTQNYPISLPNIVFKGTAYDINLTNASNVTFANNASDIYITDIANTIFLYTVNHLRAQSIHNSIFGFIVSDISTLTIESSIIADYFNYNKIGIIAHSIIDEFCSYNVIDAITYTFIGSSCYSNNLGPVYLYKSIIGACFSGNNGYGGDRQDTTITVGDYFINNTIVGGMQLNLNGYSYLYRNSFSDNTGLYGEYILTPIVTNASVVTKCMASRVKSDGSLFSFEIV